MGTYGTEPFQSDDAEQFWDEITFAFKYAGKKNRRRTLLLSKGNRHEQLMDPVYKVNALPVYAPPHARHRGRHFQTTASDHYCLARAAIELVLMSHDIGRTEDAVPAFPRDKRAEPMLLALLKMRSDKEWIASWRSDKGTQRKLVSSLNRQIRAVRKLLPALDLRRRKGKRLAAHP